MIDDNDGVLLPCWLLSLLFLPLWMLRCSLADAFVVVAVGVVVYILFFKINLNNDVIVFVL